MRRSCGSLVAISAATITLVEFQSCQPESAFYYADGLLITNRLAIEMGQSLKQGSEYKYDGHGGITYFQAPSSSTQSPAPQAARETTGLNNRVEGLLIAMGVAIFFFVPCMILCCGIFNGMDCCIRQTSGTRVVVQEQDGVYLANVEHTAVAAASPGQMPIYNPDPMHLSLIHI